MTQLIAWRAVQGIGAGGLMTLSQIVLADTFSPRERGRYQGLFTATFALCSIAGPLLGGAITALVGWRWIFLINLPFGLAVLVLLARNVPRTARRNPGGLDFGGAVLIVMATLSGLLTLSLGGAAMPWGSPAIFALGAACAAFTIGFILQEARAPEPILDLTLFRDPIFTRCALVAALIGFPFFGAIIYLPLYLQLVRGLDPAMSGMVLLPQIAGLLVASVGGGFLVSRFGRYKPFLVCGAAMMAASLALVGHAMAIGAPLTVIMTGLFLLGAGSGCCMFNLTLAVQNAVGKGRIGAATASLNFANSIAAAAGVASSGALLVRRLRAALIGHVPEATLPLLLKSGTHGAAGGADSYHDLLAQAYAHAIALAFLFGAVLLVAALCVAITVPARELRTDRSAA
jgi:MFS family permease